MDEAQGQAGHWRIVQYGNPGSGKTKHIWVPDDNAPPSRSPDGTYNAPPSPPLPSIGQMIAEDLLIDLFRRELDTWGQ